MLCNLAIMALVQIEYKVSYNMKKLTGPSDCIAMKKSFPSMHTVSLITRHHSLRALPTKTEAHASEYGFGAAVI